MTADVHAFIHALPKAETHLHLEGSIPWAMTRACYPDPLPEVPEWLAAQYRFADFQDFNDTMRLPIQYVLTSPQRIHTAAAAVLAGLAAQNVRYVEISISIDGVLSRGMSSHEVAAAIHAACPPGLALAVIGAVNRRRPLELGTPVANALLNTPGLDGIDLHGDERLGAAAPFTEIYREAHKRGLMVRAHAGELLAADTVRETLDSLRVKRIMHGRSAAADPALVQRLIDEEVTLDMCPTSNLKLRLVEDLASHPIGALLRRGVRVTCSTDDPAVFDCTLTDELIGLAEHQGFTMRELAQLQINAFQAGKLPQEHRAALIAEVETLLQSWS